MVPSIGSTEMGVKLALISSIKETLLDSTLLADYLLYCMNKQGKYHYMQLGDFKEPTDDIATALKIIGQRLGTKRRGGGVDLELAAKFFVKKWRAGDLGRLILDEVEEVKSDPVKKAYVVKRPRDSIPRERKETDGGDRKRITKRRDANRVGYKKRPKIEKTEEKKEGGEEEGFLSDMK
eukprot:TRINITY_DN1746_c0_g1_i1.p1 TRINITY_DN1746_c0_g1~~TRINITY_DN1746_c0_g1_i1.p1  ORF type:complete len:179 (-),score=41.45 TRINITY_DN1746_c0_g1_i1:9-545(-)